MKNVTPTLYTLVSFLGPKPWRHLVTKGGTGVQSQWTVAGSGTVVPARVVSQPTPDRTVVDEFRGSSEVPTTSFRPWMKDLQTPKTYPELWYSF